MPRVLPIYFHHPSTLFYPTKSLKAFSLLTFGTLGKREMIWFVFPETSQV
jgi:hypothetical protein